MQCMFMLIGLVLGVAALGAMAYSLPRKPSAAR